jgi:hypothetical protein
MNTILLPRFATVSPIVRAVLLATLTLVLLTTCDHGETVPVSTCRLTGITEVSRNSGVANPTDSAVTKYAYNDKGQLTSYLLRNVTGTQGEYYTYDANGNLKVLETNARRTDEKFTYIYTDGRLTSIVMSSFIYNYSNVIARFEYGAAGNLIQAGLPNVVYENGRIKQRFNDLGVLVSAYQYDTQGRLTREENYAGVTKSHITFEYINGKTASQALPSFKGVPEQYTNRNSTGVEGLLSKTSTYMNYGDGVNRLINTTIWTYSFNAVGFPVKRSIANANYNLDGTVQFSSSRETTYQYDNCP